MVFKLGQSGNPAGKPRGAKNKSTLLKEERRAIFDKEIEQRWLEIIKSLPPTYISDQYMGKAPEEINVKSEVEVLNPEAIELAKKYEKELKEKLDAPRSS